MVRRTRNNIKAAIVVIGGGGAGLAAAVATLHQARNNHGAEIAQVLDEGYQKLGAKVLARTLGKKVLMGTIGHVGGVDGAS